VTSVRLGVVVATKPFPKIKLRPHCQKNWKATKLPPTEWFVTRRILRRQSDNRVCCLNTSERMMLS
jgi:hypothetical protein